MEEKKLGLRSVVSTSVGLVIATSCLVSLGQGAGEIGIVFIGRDDCRVSAQPDNHRFSL